MIDADVLRIRDLRLTFRTPLGDVEALRGIDMTLKRGRILGVVGESGSGKTMTGRAIMRLVPRTAHLSGEILLDGVDLLGLSNSAIARLRGSRIAMIFQDPSAALNPVFTVGQQMAIVLRQHNVVARQFVRQRASELLAEVGLASPRRLLDTYPHELSGGMQQRVMIAMAISTRPLLLVADEPTTALDVTVQRQILDLLCRLRDSQGLTVMLITHNMAVVAQACQDVAVMYAGRTVEEGTVAAVLAHPQHPYTRALFRAQPKIEERHKPLTTIRGAVPTGLTRIHGCAFEPRCPDAMPLCSERVPPTVRTGDIDVACVLYDDSVLER